VCVRARARVCEVVISDIIFYMLQDFNLGYVLPLNICVKMFV
jgi:hypothetical protein